MAATHIYLIRHGESQANEKALFLGHGDLELTDTGRAQAQLAADYLRDIHADAIYASDLKRARSTAEATAAAKGMAVICDARLREIDGGEWEFQPFTELLRRYPEEYGLWQEDIGLSACPGGESMAQLQQRFISAVEELARENAGKTIFIFSHGGPIRALCAAWRGLPLSQMQSVPWATNASVTHGLYEDGKFSLAAYSTDHFMGDLVTALPDRV